MRTLSVDRAVIRHARQSDAEGIARVHIADQVVGFIGGGPPRFGGSIAMYQLFPDREEREFDVVRRENAARNGEDPSAAAIAESMASELSADQRDRSGQRWRIMPAFALGFGAAYLIRKHLQPK